MERCDLLLEEYKTLRQEIHVSMQNRNQILAFGLASMSALLAGAFLGKTDVQDHVPIIAMGTFGVPVAALFTLYLWCAEYVRMTRAGRHLATLERRINEEVYASMLVWECQRWTPEGSRIACDSLRAIQALFSAVIVLVPFGGVLIAGVDLSRYWWAITPWLAMPLVITVVHIERLLRLVREKVGSNPAELSIPRTPNHGSVRVVEVLWSSGAPKE
jgi:uncharacterized membrane protein